MLSCERLPDEAGRVLAKDFVCGVHFNCGGSSARVSLRMPRRGILERWGILHLAGKHHYHGSAAAVLFHEAWTIAILSGELGRTCSK